MVMQSAERFREASAEFDRTLLEVDAAMARIPPVSERTEDFHDMHDLHELRTHLHMQKEALAAQDAAIRAGRHRKEMVEQLARITAYAASLRQACRSLTTE